MQGENVLHQARPWRPPHPCNEAAPPRAQDRKRYDTSKDAEVLRTNLKERTERLAPAARKWGRNRGGMIFTEVPSTAQQQHNPNSNPNPAPLSP